MGEPLSTREPTIPQQEIISLIAQAILRKRLRERDALTVSQNKEAGQLDNSATSCLYEHHTEKQTEVDDE